MNLSQLFSTQQYNTDKNTTHSYIDHLYNNLFLDKSNISKFLEIGIATGESAKMWHDYFTNAQIYVIDVHDCTHMFDKHPRVKCFHANAYDHDFLKSLSTYDIIIDDGPHTLESILFFAQYYIYLLNDNGIAVIEDIQSESYFDLLISVVPKGFITEKIDLRKIKNRYDDLILVIRKDK